MANATAAGKGYRRTVPPAEAASHGRALTDAEIAGIAAAVVVAAILLGALAVYFLRRWRRKRRAARAQAQEPPPRRRQDTNLGPGTGGRDEDGRHAEDVPEQPGAVNGRGDGCRLCTTAYNLEAGEGPYMLDCGDRFHLRCIRRWMRHNLSCPLCNATHISLVGLGETEGQALRPQHRCSTSYGGLDCRSKDDIGVGRSISFGA